MARDYEGVIRKLIADGNESPKVDFKRTVDVRSKRAYAELGRLALAMANSDSDELEDIGYIVLGADRGLLHGGMDDLSDDAVCASLPRSLNRYIGPNARIEVRGYEDPVKGWFGAIIVRPSQAMRPHFIEKEYTSDDGKFHIRRHECYVRRGEAVELAAREDFDRMYQQRFEWQLRATERDAGPEPVPVVEWLVDGEATDMVAVPPRSEVRALRRARPGGVDDSFTDDELASMSGDELAEARKYNRELAEHLAAAEEKRDEILEHEAIQDNLNWLQAVCVNAGEAPLVDAQIRLRFPEEFFVFCEDSMPSAPEIPPRPKRPRRRTSISSALEMLHGLSTYQRGLGGAAFDRTISRLSEHHGGLYLDKDESGSCWGWIKKLSHGFRRVFDEPLAIVPPSEEDIYEVGYEVHADNLPRPMEGTLKVKVTASAAVRPFGEDGSEE